MEKLSNLEPFEYEWRTITGKVFQDVQLWRDDFKPFWAGNDPETIHKYYKERPNRRAIFMLVGNNLKSYSRGKLKNVYVRKD